MRHLTGGNQGIAGRREELLRILNQEKKVTISELEQRLGVSRVTIRNDLDIFKEQGYLYRIHGGAVVKEKLEYELAAQDRAKKNLKEKQAIARAAFSLVNGSDAVFLDSGSTVLEFSKLLKDSPNLSLVTNSFLVTSELMAVPNLNLIMIGGKVNRKQCAFTGPTTVRQLEEFYFDKVFLGTDGVSLEEGLTTDDPTMVEIEKTVIRRSKERIVLADSTKIGVRSFVRSISSLKEINVLVTDWKIKPQQLKDLRAIGLKVIVTARPFPETPVNSFPRPET